VRPVRGTYALSHDCATLEAGASCRAVVTFQPRRPGASRAWLLATSRGAAEGQAQASLLGSGGEQAVREAEPASCTPAPAVVPPTTKVLDKQTLRHLLLPPCHWCLEGDHCTLVFHGSSKQLHSLRPGDVIVSGVTDETPHGLLRRVDFLAKWRGLTFVHTRKARLQDAIQEASVCLSMQLPGPVSSSVETSNAGPDPGAASALGASIPWSFSTGTNPSVTGSGQFGTEFGLEIGIGWFTLDKFMVTNTTWFDAELTFNATAARSFDWEREVYSYEFAPITFMIGPVPVVIEPVVELGLHATGEAHARLTTGVKGRAELETRAGYEGGGWKAEVNPGWAWDFVPPTLDAGAEFRMGIVPSFHLNFYYLVGPYVAFEPYGAFFIAPSTRPWWRLAAGFDVGVGIECDLLGLDWSTTWNAAEVDVGKGGSVEGTVLLGRSGLPDVELLFEPSIGKEWTVTSGADGRYHSDLNFYETKVTPGLLGYTFAPAHGTYGPAEWRNRTGEDYAATATNWTISGMVKLKGSPTTGVEDVTVTLSSPPGGTVTTKRDGLYSFTVPNGWTGSVTAASSSHDIEAPETHEYRTPVTASLSSQDFEATLKTHDLKGQVVDFMSTSTPKGGLDGVALTFTPKPPSTGTPFTTTTSGGGLYKVTVDHGSYWTVVPTLAGYDIEPSRWEHNNVTGPETKDYTAYKLFKVSGTVRDATTGKGVEAVDMGFDSYTGTRVESTASGDYGGEVRVGSTVPLDPQEPAGSSPSYLFESDPPGKTLPIVVSSVSADVVQGFRAIASNKITGRLADVHGAPYPVAYFTIVVEPASGTLRADFPSVGDYEVEVPRFWSGRVYPLKGVFSFDPCQRAFTAVTHDWSGQDFVVWQEGVCVAGRVTMKTPDGTVPVDKVVLAGLIDRFGNIAETDATGYYWQRVDPRMVPMLVTPTKGYCTFIPPARNYTSFPGALMYEDYDAICPW
jgi:hypothetical protein